MASLRTLGLACCHQKTSHGNVSRGRCALKLAITAHDLEADCDAYAYLFNWLIIKLAIELDHQVHALYLGLKGLIMIIQLHM